MVEKIAKRVLLIGWDAADWQMIRPIMQRGHMPALKRMMDEGVWGQIATLQPILSPMLWNSISTGKTADQHGVHGFTEPLPDHTGIRPVSSVSRKCKAVWNMLHQSGMKSNVIGWYASHPAEPIHGVYVSNQFDPPVSPADQPWPIPPRSVHPPEMAESLSAFRVHPSEIDAQAVLPFMPQAQRLLSKKNHRLGKFRHLLAQTASIHAITTHLMATTEWDLTAVYFEGIDRFGHEFMEFHPPRMPQVSEEDFEVYRDVMTGIYRFHDMMLETQMKLAGPETTIILVSDHGYYNDELRPDPAKAGPTEWHRPFGIVAAMGPGIKQGGRVYGASLLDVTPTVLRLLGLPVGADMMGRPWTEIMDRTLDPHRILSWEQIPGDAGLPQSDIDEDPVAAQQALQQLIDLGYVAAPGDDVKKTVEESIACQKLNLAIAMQSLGRSEQALELLEQLPASLADDFNINLQKAINLLALKRLDECRAVLNRIEVGHPGHPRIRMLRALILVSNKRYDEAVKLFEQVAEQQSRLPGLHQRLGMVYLQLQRYPQAKAAFETALRIDGDSAVSFDGLSQAALKTGDAERAVDMALEAVDRTYHFPRAHLHLAEALEKLDNIEQAIWAVEVCLSQTSRYYQANELAARLYRRAGRPKEAEAQESKAMQCIGNDVVQLDMI